MEFGRGDRLARLKNMETHEYSPDEIVPVTSTLTEWFTTHRERENICKHFTPVKLFHLVQNVEQTCATCFPSELLKGKFARKKQVEKMKIKWDRAVWLGCVAPTGTPP